MKFATPVFNSVWACGINDAPHGGSYCISADPALGTQKDTFLFRWDDIMLVHQAEDQTRVFVSGRFTTDYIIVSDVAACLIKNKHLSCTVKSFEGTSITAGAYVPFANKFVYVGAKQSTYSSVSIVDVATDTVLSYVYTSTAMSTISLLYVRSQPVFSGGFIAGTCASAAGRNYIFAGMVRSDTGVMTGMYIAPASGSIFNIPELVNAMSLEYENPDSFIAGGLQLSDGANMQAYLLSVNSLYRSVIYGVRFVTNTNRRVLSASSTLTCAVKALALVDKALYLLINAQQSAGQHCVSVLKTDMTRGTILQQVQISLHNASIHCVDMTFTGLHLVVVCTVEYSNNFTQAVLISVNRELSFSQLPEGFIRLDQEIFVAERMAFKGISMPLAMIVDERQSTQYTLNTADGFPTHRPSVIPTSPPTSQPSSTPSGQPSSSPTSTPSISPQPTSQPSTSGPTNTYNPTVKRSQQPTPRQTAVPTVQPSHLPSISPTVRPSVSPSILPSTKPSTEPSSSKPTLAPSAKPTRDPTIKSTSTQSSTPSVSPTIASTGQKERRIYKARESLILGQVVGGLFALWCMYYLYKCWQYKVQKVKVDKKLAKEMRAQDLPGKPRYPIFSAIASLCYVLDTAAETEGDIREKVVKPASTTISAPAASINTAHHTYKGQGAYMDGPVSFLDLEANMAGVHGNNSASGSSSSARKRRRRREEKMMRKEREQLANMATEQPAPGSTTSPETEEKPAVPIMLNTDPQQSEASDLSEASSTSASGDRSFTISKNHSEGSVYSSNNSYATAGWYDLERSDDSDVVYSMSSSEEEEKDENSAADDHAYTGSDYEDSNDKESEGSPGGADSIDSNTPSDQNYAESVGVAEESVEVSDD